jgi:hypothetical protein
MERRKKRTVVEEMSELGIMVERDIIILREILWFERMMK